MTAPIRRLILGTAGHVDHGKTELVKALTGHDTDRLKEEKARGISIELGFAPLRVEGAMIGIVDVPGHERFVKQMVAGAGGIDLAMLLVAADEGVMPQTREHMEVLNSLSIPRGVVVVSKSDLASEDIMSLLSEEIADLVRNTFLEGAPVVGTSAKTRAGLDGLMETLASLASQVEPRDVSGPFRVAVDRVFHEKGIGVVVTGSCYSGSVSVGDRLDLLPAGKRARVRELQSFGEKRDSGYAGERLALALQGVKLDEVRRGDMLATPGRFGATHVVDVRVQLADYYDFELKNRERLRIHHGAREVLGRIILLEHDGLASGADALAQIKLESPLVPAPGDHFVLRKYSPPRVIGGGVVIDAIPDRHRRFDERALDQLRAKEAGDPADILLREIDRAGLAGVAARDVDESVAAALAEEGRAHKVSKHWYHTEVLARLAEEIDDMVSEFLAKNPLVWGMDKEEIRQKVGFVHGTPVFNSVLERMREWRPVFVRENRVRVGEETLELSEAAREELAQLSAQIERNGVTFASRAHLESEWRGNERFSDLVALLKDRDEIAEISGGLVHNSALSRCVDVLRGLYAESDEVSVGEFKAALNVSRKHAIPLLELFDERRVTLRSGNVRKRGPTFPR